MSYTLTILTDNGKMVKTGLPTRDACKKYLDRLKSAGYVIYSYSRDFINDTPRFTTAFFNTGRTYNIFTGRWEDK